MTEFIDDLEEICKDILIWGDDSGAVKCWKKYLQGKIKIGEERLEQMKLDIDKDKILLERIEIYEHFKNNNVPDKDDCKKKHNK